MTTCRRTSGAINIQCYYSSRQLPAEWDSFLPASHFLRSASLSVTEDAKLPDVSYIYTVVTKGNNICALAYFQLLSIREKHFDTTTFHPWQAIGWKLFTGVMHPRLLVAGHLFRHDIASFYTPADSDFEAYQMYKAAIDTVFRNTCAHAVLVKDMPDRLTTYFSHYAPQYLMLRNDISMELDIPASWNDMQDYEKALKHKYAQRFRKIRQAFTGAEIIELSQQDVEANKDRLFELYREVCERQQARIGFLNAEYLPLLKSHYPHMLKIWGIYEAGVMIGFFSAWVREETFDMFYIGFRYARNAGLQLYFNILFLSIEQAILLKKQKLILGRTALDAKARLGCRPHYLSTFVYIHNGYVRRAIQQLQNNAAAQEGEWEQRHPFKELKVE